MRDAGQWPRPAEALRIQRHERCKLGGAKARRVIGDKEVWPIGRQQLGAGEARAKREAHAGQDKPAKQMNGERRGDTGLRAASVLPKSSLSNRLLKSRTRP